MPGVVRFWANYPYRSPFHTDDPKVEVERALQHLRDVIAAENPDSIAALLIEPVVGSNGVIIPATATSPVCAPFVTSTASC